MVTEEGKGYSIMEGYSLPPVLFTEEDDNALIINEWSRIWDMDLERRYIVDFEVFGQKAQNPADAEVDFLVAVK